MVKILVVDDEAPLAKALGITLRASGYEVVTATTGAAALAAAARDQPDLVVLDLGLPDMDGTEVIAGLRPWFTAPIIVLSARGASVNKVAALDAGADDYVAKPFGMDELLARIRAALRRATHTAEAAPTVVTDDFTVDLENKQVIKDGLAVHLTPTEWGIVEVLVTNAGKLVPGSMLLAQVWGEEYRNETNYLRVYLASVRRKLEPEPSHPRYFLTEPRLGYRFSYVHPEGEA